MLKYILFPLSQKRQRIDPRRKAVIEAMKDRRVQREMRVLKSSMEYLIETASIKMKCRKSKRHSLINMKRQTSKIDSWIRILQHATILCLLATMILQINSFVFEYIFPEIFLDFNLVEFSQHNWITAEIRKGTQEKDGLILFLSP